MKSAFLLLTSALAVPLAANASSQPAPAPLEAFGRCAAKNYEGAELLATQPGSPEEAEVIAEYGRRSCNSPATDSGILRGAVAEQLFKADFGSIGAQPKRELIEVFTVDMNELAALDETAKKRIDYVAFGTCVAASDPDRSSAVLKSPAGSEAEKAAMSEMIPEFAPCINAGERFALTRLDLRSALAEGAYRLALSQSLNQEVIVTGTRDKSKSVQCKAQTVSGSHLRKTICLTEAQWETRARNSEYEAKDGQRRVREYRDRQTTCIRMSLFGGEPCLMG